MREVKPTEKKKQEQTDETTAEILLLMQKKQEQTDEALAEMMLLIAAAGKEGQEMFTTKSQLVQTWVRLINAGKYTKDDVPDISNLKEMVNKALEEG